MKSPRLFETMAVFALAALSLLATQDAAAQTVISNETLVSTTFVVNKTHAVAKCRQAGCSAKAPMFAPVTVTCPAATGQTCTFHISLDAEVALMETCDRCPGSGTLCFQFLIDDAAPTIGPTNPNGLYLFTKNIVNTGGIDGRQAFSASGLGVVNEFRFQ
jgi:hypothetical protein